MRYWIIRWIHTVRMNKKDQLVGHFCSIGFDVCNLAFKEDASDDFAAFHSLPPNMYHLAVKRVHTSLTLLL